MPDIDTYYKACRDNIDRNLVDGVALYGTASAYAKEASMSARTARRRWRRIKDRVVNSEFHPDTPSTEQAKKGCKADYKKDQALVTYVEDRVVTVEDALAKADVDVDVWEVERFVVNSWEMAAKSKDEEGVIKTPLWQVKVWLKRKDPVLEGLKDALLECVKGIIPDAPIKLEASQTEDLISFYPMADAHIGMLSMAGDWGLDRSAQVVQGCIEHCVDNSPTSKEAIMAFMGDLSHYDGSKAVTPKHGNLLQACSTHHNMPRAVRDVALAAIRKVASKHEKVTVFIIPGNHDPHSSVWLRVLLEAVFVDNDRITIVSDESSYQGYLFGKTFIGMNHGDSKQDKAVAEVFAGDEVLRGMWGKARFSYLFTADKHCEKRIPLAGCVVHRLATQASMTTYEEHGGWRGHKTMQAFTFDRHGVECFHVGASPWNLK